MRSVSRTWLRRGFGNDADDVRAGLQQPHAANDASGLVYHLTSLYNEFRFGDRREVAPEMMQLLDRLEKS